jgi:hypothetical protein
MSQQRSCYPIARAFLALVALAISGCDMPSALPRFEPIFLFKSESVSVPVTSLPASQSATEDLRHVDESLAKRVREGALLVDVSNPAGATGQATVRISGGGATVQGVISLTGGSQRITIPADAIHAFIGNMVTLTASGTLCPAMGCVPALPPYAEVTFNTRIELTVEIGGEG